MANWKTIEQQSRRQSTVFTLLFAGCLVMAMFLISFKAPEPEPEDEGMEGLLIDFGFDQTGFGDNEFIPEKTTAASQPVQTEKQEIATQDWEKAVAVPKTEVKKNTTTTTSTATQETKQEKIDPNLVLNEKLGHKGGDGNTSGNGNMGQPNGDPNGYQGNGGGVGDDGTVGWSLSGRGNVNLPHPPVAENEEGDIRVKISVDRNGNVVKADYERTGSTITDPGLINQAVTAAKKAKFTAKADAETIQIGYITYRYRYN